MLPWRNPKLKLRIIEAENLFFNQLTFTSLIKFPTGVFYARPDFLYETFCGNDKEMRREQKIINII